MKCPKCCSNKIEAMKGLFPIRDAVEYHLKCNSCGYRWSKRRGTRFRSSTNEEWKNVKFVMNRFERHVKERDDKIKRGECPECGMSLYTKDGPENDNKIWYNTSCEKCGFKIVGCRKVKC